MAQIDVVVVGAGLAGLTCAYSLAKEGFQVLVLERGDHPGSKNVSGGRIYILPLLSYLPELWDGAPLERLVTKESLTMLGADSSLTIQFTSERFRQTPGHSYTVLRSRFDRWLGEQVKAAGGILVTRRLVTSLLKQDGRCVGVVAEGEKINADCVVIADGALSPLGKEAGLRKELGPRDAAIALKEVIKLPPEVIEERFALGPNEGMASLYFGSLTEGVFGAGFLYTNRDTISLGLVLSIDEFIQQDGRQTHQILETFKERQEVARLIGGGGLLEYSAHLIPEGRNNYVTEPYGDGLLIVGDAAGLTLNLGITVRGMEYAMASGYLAAQAIKGAKEDGDFSASSLSRYKDLIVNSFVGKDMDTFRKGLEFLRSPRIRGFYPEWTCGILSELYWIGEGPKGRLSATIWKAIKEWLFSFETIREILTARRI